MTRRDIVLQILAEASGRSLQEAEGLFEAMVENGLIADRDMEETFSPAEAHRLLEDFRGELNGIRRWLCENGLLEDYGNA